MPDLSDSTPPAAPPAPPPDPVSSWDWERYPAFRSTFLYLFRPQDRTTFTDLGRLLYDLIIESPALGADDPESSTSTEMRAAALDLRHLGAFLASVGNERTVSSLALEDERLSLMAERWATEADRIGAEIEAVLKSRGEG